jgi:hypothetical protein
MPTDPGNCSDIFFIKLWVFVKKRLQANINFVLETSCLL